MSTIQKKAHDFFLQQSELYPSLVIKNPDLESFMKAAFFRGYYEGSDDTLKTVKTCLEKKDGLLEINHDAK